MASFPTAKGDYDCVDKSLGDFFCPITADLLGEAHLTLCCGNHLSQETVTKLQQDGEPCPLCKGTLATAPDKFFQRKINELKVRCRNKSSGCEWVGELGSLDRHLSQSSVEGECQFVTVACPYSCGDDLQRCQLEGHKMNDCPNRPFNCPYCGHHEATYSKVTNDHWPFCEKFPLQCRNKCGENAIERQHLPKHLEEACPLQVIRCEFSYAGCEVECQRQHMQTHLDENVKVHLSKVSCIAEQQHSEIDTLQRETEQRQQAIEQQKHQVDTLQYMTEQKQNRIDAMLISMTRVLEHVFVPPLDLMMSEFEQHKQASDRWMSAPFYSHVSGYKMCLSVHANGLRSGKNTHLSVAVRLMRGEHDDQLKWPFRGAIMIQLLNQRRSGRNHERTIVFDDGLGDAGSIDAGARVVGQEIATYGWGYGQFIAHPALYTKYLKNDCLNFRISVVKSI